MTNKPHILIFWGYVPYDWLIASYIKQLMCIIYLAH